MFSTVELNSYSRSQHSITLASLKRLTKAIHYDVLGEEIRAKNQLNHQVLNQF